MKVISSWLRRALIGVRGLLLWAQHGYPFVLAVLVVFGLELLLNKNWMQVWVTLITGVVMIVADMINFSLERLCDLVDMNYNYKIKAIKDVGAGAVLASGLVFFGVSLWILLR